jgi:kynurenine formamidase
MNVVYLTLAALVAAGQVASGQQPAAKPPANASSVTREQFDQWMTTLSNWGRWGKDDERGALNLITAEKRRQAAALVKTGDVVSLAHPLIAEKPAGTAQPRPVNRAGAAASVFLVDGDYLFERQEIEYHGSRVSHFDALCHVSHQGKVYNGLDFKQIVTDAGCSKLAVTAAQDGIVTRGILLDLPGARVRRQDVEAWEKRTGIRISAGDALLLRSRAPGMKPTGLGGAGYDPDVIPLLKQRDIALLGNDGAQEGGTIPGLAIPIHTFTIVALGLNLLDNLALDAVAATAEKLKRWEFMLVVQPLRVQNGAGSPVNAVALF